MRNKLIFVAIIALFLVGCDSGLNCPFSRPACCDNVLFGCETFDIPDGCSCGDYFSGSLTSNRALATGKFDYNGDWRLSLSRKSYTCSLASPTTNGYASIQQKKNNVKISLPGYGILKGTVSNGLLKAKGSYGPLFFGCRANIEATVSKAKAKTAGVSVVINLNCPNSKMNCGVKYSGAASKF